MGRTFNIGDRVVVDEMFTGTVQAFTKSGLVVVQLDDSDTLAKVDMGRLTFE